jgi:hypothetical protein
LPVLAVLAPRARRGKRISVLAGKDHRTASKQSVLPAHASQARQKLHGRPD